MWETLLLQLIEWAASSIGGMIYNDIKQAIANYKQQAQLATNQAALKAAEGSGNVNAIDKAGETSLNNTPQ